MKCYIVKDLLPEYIEDLCSPETADEIRAHIEECEKCRQVLNEMTTSTEPAKSTAEIGSEDIEPFKKVAKKMKRERIKIIIAIVALVVVCGIFGTLTVGQFFPSLPIPSYDSLMYRYKGWKVAKQLVKGDMEAVLGGMNITLVAEQHRDQDKFFNDIVSQLKEYHKNIFEGKDVSIHVTGVSYNGDSYFAEPEPYDNSSNSYTVTLSINVDENTIFSEVYFDNQNSYYLYIWDGELPFIGGSTEITQEDVDDISSRSIQMMNANLLYYRECCMKDSVTQFITNARISTLCQDYFSSTEDKNLAFHLFTFADDCNDMVPTAKGECYSNYCLKINPYLYDITSRCQSNTFQLTNNEYNHDALAFNATLYWTITDLNGKNCIMTKAFYYGPMGYEAVDDTEKIYADEGFDADILINLEKIFDKP